jgi:hypothetical protein
VSMSIRRIGIAAMVTAALIGLSGCGGDDPLPTTNAPISTAGTSGGGASASGPAIPSDAPVVETGEDGSTDYCANQTPFAGPVADQWGADNVMQAYCEMVAFTLDDSSWINSLLVKPSKPRDAVEFSSVKKYMTTNAQASWDALVARYLSGDVKDATDAANQMYNLQFFDLEGDGMVFTQSDGLVNNKAFSPATLGTDSLGPDGADRLNMTFTVSADVALTYNGKPGTLPMSKTVTYSLVPTGQADIPWVIDGVTGNWHTDPVVTS